MRTSPVVLGRRSAALRAAILAVLLVLLVLLTAATGVAQTPSPSDPTPAAVPPAGPTVSPTLRPTDVPAPTEEVPSVVGAANPIDAPLLGAGTVVDTILQSETLWYALDVAPGQRVGATVLVVGRPDGPESEDTVLGVTVTDPQRQPLEVAEVEFTGQADGTIELPTVEIPPIGGAQPLLSVALRSSGAVDSLEGTGYRLQLTLVIDGEPLPPEATAQPVTEDSAGEATPEPDVTVSTAPTPPPGPPDLVADLLPFALIALAVGGFAGFELSRRGL